MNAEAVDRMAAALRWLYVESRCDCVKCRAMRIVAANSLAEYEAERASNEARKTGTRTGD